MAKTFKYGYPNEVEKFIELYENLEFEDSDSLKSLENQLKLILIYLQDEYKRIFQTNKYLREEYIQEHIFPNTQTKINEKQQIKINLCSAIKIYKFLLSQYQFIKENHYKENSNFIGFKKKLNSYYYFIDDFMQFYSNHLDYFHPDDKTLIMMRQMEPFDIYDSVELSSQLLYGNIELKYFSMSKIIPGAIPFIRQTIELALKNSLNIHRIKRKNNSSDFKISGYLFLDFFKEYSSQIKFPAKLSLLRKVYEWSNIFIHTGEINYYWTIWEAQLIVHSFFPFKEKFDENHFILFDKELIDNIDSILSDYISQKLKISSNDFEIQFHNKYGGLNFDIK